MKKIALYLVATLSLLSAQSSYAGGGAHGGGGFICEDFEQSELLDLFEARTIAKPKLQFNRIKGPVYRQVQSAIDRLQLVDENVWRTAKQLSKKFISPDDLLNPELVELIDHNELQIPFPADALSFIEKRNCKSVGIGMYLDANPAIGRMEDQLLVDLSAYMSLPPTDQAAFIVHEVIYYMVRKSTKTEDSQSSRRIVAQLFASNTSLGALQKLVDTQLSAFRVVRK